MGNRFNYRCPQCRDPDYIDICNFVTIRLTASGPRILEHHVDLGNRCWSAHKTARYAACGYKGVVKDFAPSLSGDAERLAAATIKRLEDDPGDKLAAALARLARVTRETRRVVSLNEFRHRRR
jgi:hypothetical protein